MYSILIKNGTNTFTFAIDDASGEKYAGSLAEVKEKFNQLLQKYPISKLEIVHNCIVNADLTITDVE